MRPFLLLVFLLHAPALAGEPAEQEVARLHQRMQRLAQKNAWSGVERTFHEIQATGEPVERPILMLAADAARNRGDVLSHLARLIEAQSLASEAATAATIDDLGATFGRVQIEGRGTLSIRDTPFRPDAQQAVAYAQAELERSDLFDGYLPAGEYSFADRSFTVTPGADALVVSTLAPGETLDLTVQGVSFPRRANVGGTRLVLNGAAERSKLGIAVYVGALYLQERTSSPVEAIRQDLPKRLVMHFVFRKTPQSAIVDFFQQGFDKVPGSENLRGEIRAFLSAFEAPMLRGDKLVFDYEPGVGTRVLVNGKTRVVIRDLPFMWALFRLFLGDDPPTDKLKSGLLGTQE